MATILDSLARANGLREKYHKDEISLCAIVNAKSGLCAEDCSFCSQSLRNKANAIRYPMLPPEKIFERAKEASKIKAACFGIVTSGKSTGSKRELAVICRALEMMRKKLPRLERAASLGILGKKELANLKEAGLQRYHHNLETSRRFFARICATHTYEERLATIISAKEAGLKVCSGGLFGLGESLKDRTELAQALKKLGVDSVPLNFLNPIKGTRLENKRAMPPLEILRTIALFRTYLPGKDIKVCGGRNVNLRSLQCMIFFAGANGMMTGNYLTTAGNNPQDDLQMIKDLGLRIKG